MKVRSLTKTLGASDLGWGEPGGGGTPAAEAASASSSPLQRTEIKITEQKNNRPYFHCSFFKCRGMLHMLTPLEMQCRCCDPILLESYFLMNEAPSF